MTLMDEIIEANYGRHLPIFPTFDFDAPTPITEDGIERTVERLVDRADKAFMAGKTTQAQYDRWSKRLNEWATDQINTLKARR